MFEFLKTIGLFALAGIASSAAGGMMACFLLLILAARWS